MLAIFDNDLFHMGGDEVHMGCWNSSSEITDWMTDNDYGTDTAGFMRLWGRFQSKGGCGCVCLTFSKVTLILSSA